MQSERDVFFCKAIVLIHLEKCNKKICQASKFTTRCDCSFVQSFFKSELTEILNPTSRVLLSGSAPVCRPPCAAAARVPAPPSASAPCPSAPSLSRLGGPPAASGSACAPPPSEPPAAAAPAAARRLTLDAEPGRAPVAAPGPLDADSQEDPERVINTRERKYHVEHEKSELELIKRTELMPSLDINIKLWYNLCGGGGGFHVSQ